MALDIFSLKLCFYSSCVYFLRFLGKLFLCNSATKDSYAVALVKDGDVGHVPYNISAIASHFLCRECNKEVTGNEVNRGGYGLEVPCKYRF